MSEQKTERWFEGTLTVRGSIDAGYGWPSGSTVYFRRTTTDQDRWIVFTRRSHNVWTTAEMRERVVTKRDTRGWPVPASATLDLDRNFHNHIND